MDLNRYFNNKLRILYYEQNSEGLTPNEIQLLDALAMFADMQRWPKEFAPRNNVLLTLTQWGSEAKIKRVRASLMEKGFIVFQPRKRKAGIYAFTAKITGQNSKKASKTSMSYSSASGSNMIHLYKKQPKPVQHQVKQTSSYDIKAEQRKADHERLWELFDTVFRTQIEEADYSEQQQIKKMFYELDTDFLNAMITRFDGFNWKPIINPGKYLITCLNNDLNNQKIRDEMRTKENKKRG